MLRKIGFFALLLLFAGCNKPIFTQINDYSIVSASPISASVVGDMYGVVKIKNDPNSNIEIRVQKIKASCSTEHSRSLGSDFDGYILIEVYRDKLLMAKAQMDFKTEPVERDFEVVWGELVKKLKWHI
jgi:hypothetical protein